MKLEIPNIYFYILKNKLKNILDSIEMVEKNVPVLF